MIRAVGGRRRSRPASGSRGQSRSTSGSRSDPRSTSPGARWSSRRPPRTRSRGRPAPCCRSRRRHRGRSRGSGARGGRRSSRTDVRWACGAWVVRPQRQLAADPVELGDRAARLHRRRVRAGEDHLLLDDHLGGGEDPVGGRRVAGLPVEDVVVVLARACRRGSAARRRRAPAAGRRPPAAARTRPRSARARRERRSGPRRRRTRPPGPGSGPCRWPAPPGRRRTSSASRPGRAPPGRRR